jgi:hypothetical protein
MMAGNSPEGFCCHGFAVVVACPIAFPGPQVDLVDVSGSPQGAKILVGAAEEARKAESLTPLPSSFRIVTDGASSSSAGSFLSEQLQAHPDR